MNINVKKGEDRRADKFKYILIITFYMAFQKK